MKCALKLEPKTLSRKILQHLETMCDLHDVCTVKIYDPFAMLQSPTSTPKSAHRMTQCQREMEF